jgi:hypothetical protein
MGKPSGASSPASLSLAGLQIDPGALARLPKAERQLVADQLREVEEAFKRNPLLAFKPHEKQQVFMGAPHPPSRLFLGGNRSGKSTCTMVDTIVQCLDWELVPEHLQGFKRWEPPFYGRVVTPDLTNTMEGVVLQKFREWCPRESLKGGSFDRAWDKVARMLRFKNGSWVQFFSNDQDLDKFGGAALHRVVYDEEPRADIRRECLMRLIDYGGEELYGCTPLHGMNWIYDEFFAPWERGQLSDEDVRIVVVDMDDNPYLNEQAKQWVLSGLSSEERASRKSGKFSAFAGLIFPEFTREHVIPELSSVPEGVEVFAGIDPGIRHLCAVLFCYLDQADTMVVFDEIALKDKTIRDICAEIGNRNDRWRVKPRWYVIDPAARNRNNQTGRGDQQEFADHGIYTFPGQTNERTGIDKVRQRLEADRLRVTANCVVLREEFKKYRWMKDSTRTENAAPERPVDRDNHCFVAGTLVATARGDVAIEAVRLGDRVLTRGGYCTVVASAPTRTTAVRTLRFEDGRELTGSEDHPCVVQRDGCQRVLRLDAVRCGDTMLLCHESKWSSFKGFASVGIWTRSREQIASTFDRTWRTVAKVLATCTSRFGRPLTALSPAAGIYTIATGTPSITLSPTWNASPGLSTLRCIWTPNVSSGRDGTPRRSGRWRWLGILRRKAERGTASTAGLPGRLEYLSPVFATTAAQTSNASPGVTWTGSAPISANRRGVERRASTTRGEIARSAGERFESTSIPGSSVAPVRVVANHAAGSSPVHNLTVYGHAEFFANGLLVLNCLDALRYIVMARPLKPDVDMPRPNETQKDRILRHHLKRLKRPAMADNGSGPGIFV